MYRPHEILAKMPPALATEMLGFIQTKEPGLYQATVSTLCKQRKLRPIFIERKPKNERLAFIASLLGRAQNESVAAHLLQIWFVGAHSKLLCDFLDALGIKHDEHGTVEALPPAPPKEDLQKAIETARASHDPAVVAVYLHAFQALDDEGGWTTLEELLKEDPQLQLGAASPA